MAEQIPILESVKKLLLAEGLQLLSTVRETIQIAGKQNDDFALSLGVAPSQMSAALNNKNYAFNLLWLPAALHLDQRRKIIGHQARLVGCRVVDSMSDAEKVRRWESAARRAGTLGDALRRDAMEGDEP
jgi:hypothetical protein